MLPIPLMTKFTINRDEEIRIRLPGENLQLMRFLI